MDCASSEPCEMPVTAAEAASRAEAGIESEPEVDLSGILGAFLFF